MLATKLLSGQIVSLKLGDNALKSLDKHQKSLDKPQTCFDKALTYFDKPSFILQKSHTFIRSVTHCIRRVSRRAECRYLPLYI